MSFLTEFRSRRSRKLRKPESFTLVYSPPSGGPVTVGRLDFDGDVWTFAYADEYKRREDLRPLEGFSDVERVYRSQMLFPFFAVRIPDRTRTDVRDRLDKDQVQDPGPSDLLRLFGRRVVSSPGFELIPAH
jgi:hypothetical protein